jgi:hypothetical protein
MQRSLLITVICPAACRCSSASWQCRDRPFAEMGSPSPSTTWRRVKRTRRPRPAAAGLAGLPHHRRGRNLPQLAVGVLVRRTIFRSAADERDHLCGASLDRRGGMTLPQNRMSSVIPLFGQSTDHSSVGQDSHGWRAQRPSRAAARPARQRFTLDGCEHDGSVAISWDDTVHRGDLGGIDTVERRGTRRAGVVGHTSPERFIRPSLRGIRYRSVKIASFSRASRL